MTAICASGCASRRVESVAVQAPVEEKSAWWNEHFRTLNSTNVGKGEDRVDWKAYWDEQGRELERKYRMYSTAQLLLKRQEAARNLPLNFDFGFVGFSVNPQAGTLAEIDRELLRRRESGERDEADGTVGAGTGFVIAVSGYVLTCDHVTRKSNHIEVRDNSGKKRAAKVVVADPKNDLCILYVEGLESPAIPTAPVNSVRTGEIVYSLGFPLQRNLENQNPVAGSGVVASLQGMAGDPRFLQVTVPLNPGNSGGPIIDVYGRWIGDTSLILTDRVVPKGLMPQGANFAVKATLINPLLDYLPKKELPLGSNSKSLTLAEAASRLSGSVVLITVKH